MSACGLMQIDTTSPSEMEVIEEIGFLKRYKAAVSDGLSPFSLDNGGDVLTSDLTKLLRSI